MAAYKIQGATLTGIADAIRGKKGTTAAITPENMASEIAGLAGSAKVPRLGIVAETDCIKEEAYAISVRHFKKVRYGDEILPMIPEEGSSVGTYPYVVVFKRTINEKLYLVMANGKYFYNAPSASVVPGGSTVRNYMIDDGLAETTDEWPLKDTTLYTWPAEDWTPIWANYDIFIGSVSGTEIHLAGSPLIPYFEEE